MTPETQSRLCRTGEHLAAAASVEPLMTLVGMDLLVAGRSRWDEGTGRLILEAAVLILNQPEWSSREFSEVSIYKANGLWVVEDNADHTILRKFRKAQLRIQFITGELFQCLKRFQDTQLVEDCFKTAREHFPELRCLPARGMMVCDAPALSTLVQEFAAERKEILRHKWLESEKAGHDLGFQWALTDWIIKHRAKWRQGRRGPGGDLSA